MKNPTYPGILAGMLLACLCLACNPPAAREPQPEPGTAVPIASPAETATLVILATASPTETATLEPPATIALSPVLPTKRVPPICERSMASTLAAPLCQRPIAEQSSLFCLSKKPYNLILVETGATYRVLTEGFTCSQAGMQAGRQLLMCNGPMGTSFEVEVCGQPACTPPTLAAESSQCPQGFWYDEPQGCCAFIPQPVESSCITLRLKTKMCATNCAVYSSASACDSHYPACQWDEEDKICRGRQ